MTIQKKIYFLIGGIILLSLSITLLFLYREDITQEPPAVATNERINSEEQQPPAESIDSINIIGEDNTNQDYAIGDDELDEDEVRESVVEALGLVTLTETLLEPSERSFFEHAILDYVLTNVMGDNVAEENDPENEAEWVAKDIIAWLSVAENKTEFSYSESSFIQYVKDENLIEEDLRTRVLLEELKDISETLYIRHLEFKFIKPFIWNTIQNTFRTDYYQSSDESEEEYMYRVYSQFEEEVMTHLLEKYPELWQD